MWILAFIVVYLSHITGIDAKCALGPDVIHLTSWKGNISSPAGTESNQYPNRQHCQWDIRVSEGSRIKLTFLKFDLEDGYFKNSNPGHGQKRLCNDAVQILDGDKQVFSGCQDDGQDVTVESSGNKMTVVFSTDESGQKSGFLASYEGVCGAKLKEKGILESPNFPYPAPQNVTCSWTISTKGYKIIFVHPDKNATDLSLPDCGSKVLTWHSDEKTPYKVFTDRELCKADSKIVATSEVTLTYDPKYDGQWTGRYQLEYGGLCTQFCDHGGMCHYGRSMDLSSYTCLCPKPYNGTNCEVYNDPCLSSPRTCSGAGRCQADKNGTETRCECNPGYKGEDCEVNPCNSHPCLHGGKCQVDGDAFTCDCPEGFEPPDCRVAHVDDPCDSSPCQHLGTCRKDGAGGFTCTCTPAYTGAVCSILDGDAHCPEEQDSTAGSGIRWADTLAGSHDNQPCPRGVTGVAKRNCMKEERSPTGGVWKRPDLSACISPDLVELSQDSQSLMRVGVSGGVLYDVTRRLANVTSNLKTSQNERTVLYPGDLLVAADVLHAISTGVINALAVDENAHSLTEHFTMSMDNILHPQTLDVWKNARVRLVENKITSLLTSAQRFVENMVQRQSDARNTAVPPVSNVTSHLLTASGDAIELLVTSWDKVNTTWTPGFSRPGGDALTNDTSMSSTIQLPADILNIARGDGTERNVKLYAGRFTTLAPLLSLKEYRYTRETEDNATKLVNSDIISAEVLDLPTSAFSKLDHPVQITFRLKDPNKRSDLKKYCVFMNMSATDPAERWLTDGCHLHEVNATHVLCYCYHLTNFAVLLDVYDQAEDLDEANSAALAYISYIGGSLSILACVVVIVVFEYFRLSSDRVRIHEQLAVSIIFVQVLFLIGVGRTTADHDTPAWACKTVAITLHFSLTALFCWMLVEGIHIYILLVKVFKRGSHLKKYCVIGWGIPFLVVGISVGVFYDKYGAENVCWLTHELLLVCFVPTVALVIVINTVILVLVLRVMLRSLNSAHKANVEQQSSIRTSMKASAVLLPLLGLTWTLGFLAVDFQDSHAMVYIFTYLFTICNSFQGVLFFLFHCLLNVDVHNAYERRYTQRKRAASSSLETPTRKTSEGSTWLTDGSPQSRSTTKTNFSDISIMHRKPAVANNRFLLLDADHRPVMVDPTHQLFDQPPQDLDTSYDHHGAYPYDDSTFDYGDKQEKRLWRRYSLERDPYEDRGGSVSLRRSPSFPSRPRPDLMAFATSLHSDGLPRAGRNSVHFLEDE